jgi:hypothetical protein
MAEGASAPDAAADVQAQAAPAGTTANATEPADGQGTADGSSASTGQAAAAPAAQMFDEHFDPKTLPAELQPAYKQMHGVFTRKMQSFSQDRDLLDQAKSFMADPVAGMQRMAAQYGYQLTRREAQAALGQQQGGAWDPASGEAPPDWNTLLSVAEQRAEQRLMQKFAPVIQNVQQMQASSIEKQLDDLDPQWRTYEDSMRSNLKDHPTLVKNVEALYRLSVPAEVIESRATQAALARIQKTTQAAKVSGTSTARSTSPAPRKIESFQDAVEAAKEQLNRR